MDIVTKEDLELFRIKLLEDIKRVLAPTPMKNDKEWLRSSEVRKILKISPGTLQSLRISGKLHPSKIGGILYYRKDELMSLLER